MEPFNETEARKTLRQAKALRVKLAATQAKLDKLRSAYMYDRREYGISRERFEASL